jgi:hypothetical protein
MTKPRVANLFVVFSVFGRTRMLITVKYIVYSDRAPTGLVAEIVYSVLRFLQTWEVRGSIPGENEVFPVCPD